MGYFEAFNLSEKKLREALSYLSAIRRLTMTGTWEILLNTNTASPMYPVNLSEEACFLTGYTDHSIPVNEHLSDVIPVEDQKYICEKFKHAVEMRTVFSVKHRLVHRGRQERLLYQRGELFYDAGSKTPVKMLCICCDVTNSPNETYQQPMDEDIENEPAFVASHALRAPLSNIIGLSNMLTDIPSDVAGAEKIKELAVSLTEQARRLDNAVHRLNSLMSRKSVHTFSDKISSGFEELVLIDDEPLVNKIHSRLIESAGNQKPIKAFTNPREGMRYLKCNSHKSLLVLLDINMPEMNAWDCLQFMEKHRIDAEVVILSSSINPEDKERALEFKLVRSFMNKPVNMHDLRWLLGVPQK